MIRRGLPAKLGGALLIAALGILARPAGAREPPETAPSGAGRDLFHGLQERVEWVMGTRLRIAVEVPPGRDGGRLLAEGFALVRAADRLLSNYRRRSELSRLNGAAGRGWRQVSSELYAFLRDSLAYSRGTDGAFDLTVGGLLPPPGGRRPGPVQRPGAPRPAVGYRHLQLAPNRRVRLARAGLRLDPGAIGKGWALERLVTLLRARGVRRGFVDFGGSSFYGLGAPVGHPGWPVLLPGLPGAAPVGILLLRDASLSASLSIRIAGDGRERPHIVDPRSGRLVRQRRLAAVLSPSATAAEVLATALVVEPRLRRRVSHRFPGACAVTQIAGRPPVIASCAAPRLRRLPGHGTIADPPSR